MKKKIKEATALIGSLNQSGIRTLASKHFPQVERGDLIDIYSEVYEALAKEQYRVTVEWKERQFLVESKNAKELNKNRTTFYDYLKQLKSADVLNEKIIGKAVVFLHLFIRVEGNVIGKHPALVSLLDVVRKKKTLLETAHRNVLALHKAQMRIPVMLITNSGAS